MSACAVCGESIKNRLDQFQKRTEYRRVDGNERALVIAEYDICRGCVMKIKFPNAEGQGVLT